MNSLETAVFQTHVGSMKLPSIAFEQMTKSLLLKSLACKAFSYILMFY